MTIAPQISGFPASNRYPMVAGEVLYGTGGQTGADGSLQLLVCGLKSSAGTITPDTQIARILSTADADNYAGVGSELACMLYDALKTGGNAGVPIYACSPTPANGAVAASAMIKFNGTATSGGGVTVRVNGKPVPVQIPQGYTAAQAATALANGIAGAESQRTRLTATASTVYTQVVCRTAGVRGNQDVIFLDITGMPAGMTATLYVTWSTSQTWAVGDQVVPSVPNGYYYKCTTGNPGSTTTEPTWPTTVGTTVTDGTAVWTCWGTTATGASPTTAVFLGSGSGLETYTLLLAALKSSYDTIAIAANDSVSMAAWKAQLDGAAGAPTNFLQNAVVALNGTEAAAQSIAQTTLNDPLFEVLWNLNGETHPSRLAAQFAAIRTLTEQSNPNANYNNFALAYVAPQTQDADKPDLPTLITCINNGVTPVGIMPAFNDGVTRVGRAIVTKCLTAGSPDYATLDVGQVRTPQFVFRDQRVVWNTTLGPNNPVCRADEAGDEKRLPAGVMTPRITAATFFARLVSFAKGVLSGSSQQVPPIVQPPVDGDVQGSFDGTAKRIVTVTNVRVMPNNAQLGTSVRQSA